MRFDGKMLLTFLAFTLWPTSATVGATIDREEQLLRQARIDTSPLGLLEFLRQRARAEQDPKQLEALIRQLGSDHFAERERASRGLVAAGPRAIPLLRGAVSDPDVEVVRRARDCLQQIERNVHAALPLAVIRLLVRRHPAGTVETLLAYLPSAGEEAVEEEILYGLAALAVHDGKIDPALLAALHDPVPLRRAAAGCILARQGGPSQRAAVRRLLTDRHPLVRLRTAQGLLADKDREAIPVLLPLLEEAPIELAWEAEEFLHWIAGETAPESVLGVGSIAARKKCRGDWEAWWRRHGSRLDLTEPDKDQRRPGLVLVHEAVRNRLNRAWSYRVWIGGCDGRPRWILENLPALADLEWLPGGRLLLAERNSNRLLERDLNGKIIRGTEIEEGWTLIACRRLANGNTFLATTGTVQEIGPRGEEIYKHHLHQFHPAAFSYIRQARKRNNGRILCVTADGAVLEVDPTTGQASQPLELKAEQVPAWQFRILNDERFLIPVGAAGRFQEMDGTGRSIAHYTLPHLQDAVRLRDGLTLVACADAARGQLLAVDGTGRENWRAYCEGEPHLVRVCLRLVRFGFDPPHLPALDPVKSRVRELGRRYVPARRGAAADLSELGPPARSAVPALVTALADADEEVRRGAVQALAEIGPAGYPEVVRALKAPSPVVRAGAASVLARSGSAARLAAADLIELLHDANGSVRVNAAKALARVGPHLAFAERDLLRLLNDKDTNIRQSAVAALESLAARSPTVRQALLDAFQGSDQALRCRVGESLGRIGSEDERILAALIAALKDKETSVAVSAATALGQIGPKAKAAVPSLLDALRGPEADLREPVLEALARIGPEAKIAAPLLMDIFKDATADRFVREAAAGALGQIGPEARSAIPMLKAAIEAPDNLSLARSAYAALAHLGPDAVPILVEQLKKRDPKRGLDGAEAIQALGQMGPAAKNAVPELLLALEDKAPYAFGRKLVPYALGDIGPAAKAALPRLLQLVKVPDSPFAPGALYALPRIGPRDKTVFAALLATLKDRDRPLTVRSAAAWSLACMDPAVGDAVSPLIEALKTPNGRSAALSPGDRRKSLLKLQQSLREERRKIDSFQGDLRICACIALGRIGPRAARATPAIAELLRGKNQDIVVRWSAAWTLGEFGAEGRVGIPALQEVLKDPDAPVELRGVAAAALARMRSPAVPALREALGNPNWCTRYWALESLAMMGPPAEAAVPTLQEICSGPDKLLARAAALTLKNIRKE